MKLYRVTVEHTFFMVAKNDHDAVKNSEDCAREAVREDVTLDLVSEIEIDDLADIPSEWRECYPYGEGGNTKTCAEWLAQRT